MNTTPQYERMWAKGNRFFSIVGLIHPTAVLVFGGAAFLLAVLAIGAQPDWGTALTLALSMMCGQAVVGLTNEICGLDEDRIAKPWRALPAGYISVKNTALLAVALMVSGLALAARISWIAAELLFLGTGVGLLYNVWLKGTVLSWLPHAIAYPSIPVWVWASLSKFDQRLLWLYLLAFPLVSSIHLAHQLQDFEMEERLEEGGIVQIWGRKKANEVFYWALVVAPLPFLLGGIFTIDLASSGVALFGAIVHWRLVLSEWPRSGAWPGPDMYRRIFKRLQLSGPLLIVSWLVGILR